MYEHRYNISILIIVYNLFYSFSLYILVFYFEQEYFGTHVSNMLYMLEVVVRVAGSEKLPSTFNQDL